MTEVQQTLNVIEIVTTRFGMGGATAQAMTSHANQKVAPSGGVGDAAGAMDTAAHRDDVLNLINQIRLTLVNNGMMKGSA